VSADAQECRMNIKSNQIKSNQSLITKQNKTKQNKNKTKRAKKDFCAPSSLFDAVQVTDRQKNKKQEYVIKNLSIPISLFFVVYLFLFLFLFLNEGFEICEGGENTRNTKNVYTQRNITIK
jgi:hypothetical protein